MKKFYLIILLALSSISAWGQTFTIRITPDAGFDAIDTIYNEFNNLQPQTILTVLNSHPPADVGYLIQNRPTGNRLELMIASPDWAAAQLARMMLIKYPYPIDVTAVLENLENHPSVEVVYYNYNLDPIDFTPAQPIAEEPITMELAFLPVLNCQVPSINSDGLSYVVEVIDNTINVLRVGSSPFPSTSVCTLHEAPMISYELGQLERGIYTINIYNVFNGTSFPAPEIERYFMGQTTLVVQGTEPTTVPTLSFWFLIFLTGALIIIGYKKLPNSQF